MEYWENTTAMADSILGGFSLGEQMRRARVQEELERRALAERELANQRGFQFDYDQLGQRQQEFGLDRERFEYGQAMDQMAEEARAAEAQQRRQALRESFTPYATVPGPMGVPRVDVNQLERLVNAPEWYQRQFVEQADAQRAQQQAQLQEKRARDRVRSMFAAKGMLGEWEKIEAEHELTGTWPKGLGLQDDRAAAFVPPNADALAAHTEVMQGLMSPDPAVKSAAYAKGIVLGIPASVLTNQAGQAETADERTRRAEEKRREDMRKQIEAEESGRLEAEAERIDSEIDRLQAERKSIDGNTSMKDGAKKAEKERLAAQILPLLEIRNEMTRAIGVVKKGGMTEEMAIRMAASELGEGADTEALLGRAAELLQRAR